MFRSTFFRRGFKTCLLILVVLIGLIGGFIGWLVGTPRPATDWGNQLIASLQSPQDLFELRVGKVELALESVTSPIVMRFKELRIYSKAYESELIVPSGEAELRLFPLLWGDIDVSHLKLSGLKGGMRIGDESWYLLNDEGELLHRFLRNKNEDELLFPVRQLSVMNASLSVKWLSNNGLWQMQNLALTMTKAKKNQIAITMASELVSNETSATTIEVNGSANMTENTLAVEAAFSQLPSALLCQAAFPCEASHPRLDMSLDGVAKFTIEQDDLQKVNLVLSGQNGTVHYEPGYEEPLQLSDLNIAADINVPKRQMKVSQLELMLDKTTKLALRGMFSAKTDAVAINAAARVRNMPVDALKRYWPANFAPQTWQWVTSRITGGRVSDAEAQFQLSPQDFAAEHLPDDFVESRIVLEGAQLDYDSHVPPLKSIDGTLRIGGNHLRFAVDHASLLDQSTISGGMLEINDFNGEKTSLSAELPITSTAQDVLTYLRQFARVPLDHDGINASDATGDIIGTLTFNEEDMGELEASHPAEGLQAHVKGRVEDVDGLFVHSFKLQDIQGSFDFQRNQQSVELTGRHEEKTYMLGYESGAKQAETIRLQGPLNAEMFKAFSPTLAEKVSGNVAADLTLRRADKKSWIVEGEADASDAKVSLALLGYEKPKGERALLRFSKAEGRDGTSWVISSPDLNAKGWLQWPTNAPMPAGLEISELQTGRQDFSLRYRQEDAATHLIVRGASVDVGPMLKQFDHGRDERSLITEFPALQLDTDVERLYVDSHAIADVTLLLECPKGRCIMANVHGRVLPENEFHFRIYQEGGARKLQIRAGDIGELIRLYAPDSSLYGGRADIKGAFNDAEGGFLQGRAIVTNFMLRDAPILGQILSAGSLLGLVDALNSGGIRFTKFASDFELGDDLLRLLDGKAAGPSMGVLIDGDFNLATNLMDVRGNIAPAHVINSLLGKVPVIGTLLAGGEGESVFAINYTVKGDMSDPRVLVNPLSALTPGFTRQFFEMFDAPPDTGITATDAPAANQQPTVPDDGLKWQVINP